MGWTVVRAPSSPPIDFYSTQQRDNVGLTASHWFISYIHAAYVIRNAWWYLGQILKQTGIV
jgi:hypothetical protein